MYIENTGGYYDRDGTQHARRGRFLILVQTEDSTWYETRAIVRKVALTQCGHWMTGSARAWGHRIPISGAYGGDGLPRTVPQEVYDRATPVPGRLMDELNKGGGWNNVGSEALAMRQWAQEVFK
jgi:hypothetical protein